MENIKFLLQGVGLGFLLTPRLLFSLTSVDVCNGVAVWFVELGNIFWNGI